MTHPILIVDDSPIMRAMMRKALGLIGYFGDQIGEASDGVSALDWLATATPSLIFADIHMPRMTGIELIETLAADPKRSSLPVVVVSSDAGANFRDQLLALGVRAVLRKPFRPEQVRAIIRGINQAHSRDGQS